MIKNGDVIAVWFSCGAASAVAAKKIIEKYGDVCKIRIINNPIAEEDEDNRRFLKDVESWLGVEIEIAINKDWPNCSAKEVWEKRKFMGGRIAPGKSGAPCTQELKKFARQQWENENHHDHIVLGFTLEEKDRAKRFKLTERSNFIPVLIDDEITKQKCFEIIQDAGIRLPRIYDMGYPNANCIGCIKVSSATYWNHVRGQHPIIFLDRSEQSKYIGRKLVRCHPKYLDWCSKHEDNLWYDDRTGKCLHKWIQETSDNPEKHIAGHWKLESPRIFLDELPPLAKGREMKNLKSPDCGIFCEEKE